MVKDGLVRNCEISIPEASVTSIVKCIVASDEVTSTVEGVKDKFDKTGASDSLEEFIVTPPLSAPSPVTEVPTFS